MLGQRLSQSTAETFERHEPARRVGCGGLRCGDGSSVRRQQRGAQNETRSNPLHPRQDYSRSSGPEGYFQRGRVIEPCLRIPFHAFERRPGLVGADQSQLR